jgi:hypothetical protein
MLISSYFGGTSISQFVFVKLTELSNGVYSILLISHLYNIYLMLIAQDNTQSKLIPKIPIII